MARTRRRVERPMGPIVGDAVVFGARFFADVLPGMVRACPCPAGNDVACFLYLTDGSVLDVVQVLALTDRFCVLAVVEGEGDDGVERTEDDVGLGAVPYEIVARASIRPVRRKAVFGFQLAETPQLGSGVGVEPLLLARTKKKKKKKKTAR